MIENYIFRDISYVFYALSFKMLNKIKNIHTNAGWSSLVARQAHNLKVVGSNPTPATNYLKINLNLK